jgi:hypothetical protein
VAVALTINSKKVVTNAELEGKIIIDAQSVYFVDFSVDAKKKQYIGNYSNVYVNSDKCVKLGE